MKWLGVTGLVLLLLFEVGCQGVESMPTESTPPLAEQGPKGSRGDIGDTGLAGSQGLPGLQGVMGPQGEKGPPGDVGDSGRTGPQGPRGFTGAAGARGDKGNAGIQGPAGSQGEMGETGDTGLQGPAGNSAPVWTPPITETYNFTGSGCSSCLRIPLYLHSGDKAEVSFDIGYSELLLSVSDPYGNILFESHGILTPSNRLFDSYVFIATVPGDYIIDLNYSSSQGNIYGSITHSSYQLLN